MAFEDVYADVSSTSYVAGYYDEVNDEYADVLQDLLPTGPAWNYADGSEEHSLLRALGYPLKRIVLRGLDLLREFHPDTMFELLSDWERVLGLPGDNPSPPSTLAERRAAVHARLLGYGDPTPAFYEEIAEGLGYVDPEVISVPFSPFVAGSTAGSDLSNNDGGGWAFTWYLNVDSSDSDDTLEWFMDNLIPAHTTLLVSYMPVLTEQDNPKNVDLHGICYGDNLWVAVGAADGVDGYIITSDDDGETWIERSNPKNVKMRSVAWNGSQYVAVGYSDGADSYILTSSDGVTWAEQVGIVGKTNWLYGVCWGAGQWVAVGDADADSFIITSPDGSTWTEQSTPTAVSLYGVAYDGSDLFVAVGDSTGAGACILTSPDGVTWTSRSNPQNVELNGVAHDYNQTWVAVGGAVGGDAYLITSANGITWSEVATSKNTDLYAVAYDWMTRLWIATGTADGTDAYVLVSRDAETWEELTNPKNFSLYGVASGGLNKWIAVGVADGTDGYVVGFIKE